MIICGEEIIFLAEQSGALLRKNEEGKMSSYEDLKSQILNIRRNRNIKPKRLQFEISMLVTWIIRQDLKRRGSFYNDTRCAYFFFEDEKQLVEIGPDNNDFMLVLARYGINRAEPLFKYIFEDLCREAFENGEETEIHRLAYYNQETFTVYLFNHNNQIYRISPDAIELVDNGTDGVLFLSDAKTSPFDGSLPELFISRLDDTIFSDINFDLDVLSPNERRALFILWFYCLFFESIMPTKPILTFLGEKGSGKTTSLRKVGLLLFGKDFNVTSLSDDPKDFDAAVTNSHYVVIDNADDRKPWLDDKLSVSATGGSVKKRELYTTNRMVDFPIRCFLAITARTPAFRRDDVADRLLIMRVGRVRNFKSERHMIAQVLKDRDFIMSEVVRHLQEVVCALRDYKNNKKDVAFRMADFAEFALTVAHYAERYDQVKIILRKLALEQTYFTLEDDPIFDLLFKWVPENQGREVTAAELCNELSALAIKYKIEFPYEDKVQSFAQRLNNLYDNLSKFFNMTRRRGQARKAYYSFSMKLKDRGEAGAPDSS
jgi:hypothetical protein